MSIKENVRVVKDFFAAMGSGDKQALLALVAEDIEWIIPRQGLAAGRYAPRAHGVGGYTSEGI